MVILLSLIFLRTRICAGSWKPVSSRSKSIPNITIIVPTFNEHDNVEPLVEQINRCLAGRDWEILFVDDNSSDHTASQVEKLGRADPRIKCLLRVGRRGLSSACIEGILASSSPLVAVMDGDLQHDAAILPKMIDVLSNSDVQIAIGSRYTNGGNIDQWTFWRKMVSGTATILSRVLIPEGLTDPMSGYFVIRRDLFIGLADQLSGKGFKILLDIFSSSTDNLNFVEVPYSFGVRHSGKSKLRTHVVLEFCEMVVDKFVGRYLSPKFFLFVCVGLTGVMIHLLALGLFNQLLVIGFGWSQFLAIWAAMTSNFWLNNLVTYRETPLRGREWWRGLITFYTSCGFGALVNIAIAVFLFDLEIHWLLSGLGGAVVGAVWNYSTTRITTWHNP